MQLICNWFFIVWFGKEGTAVTSHLPVNFFFCRIHTWVCLLGQGKRLKQLGFCFLTYMLGIYVRKHIFFKFPITLHHFLDGTKWSHKYSTKWHHRECLRIKSKPMRELGSTWVGERFEVKLAWPLLFFLSP